MSYKTIHTLYGLQRMAAAEATGIPINLVEMAVGDGNGNPVTPTEEQTQLAREKFRATVNRVYQDPENPAMFTAELIIPASEGGFVIRECGIFDDQGGLFAVANTPDTYKPNESEGAYSDTVLRLVFLVSNSSVVTLMVDPNVAVATHTWIINNVTPGFLLPGGTTNQILTKASNADGDTEWRDPTAVNVVVNTIEETQTLADAQTLVELTTTTTQGAALYIEGVRLRADQWTPDGADITKLTLAQSYPAGTKLVAAQNEPAGLLPDPLVKSQNLADVPDKPTARTNLDVYNRAETDTKAPVSLVAYFARNTAPAGWMKANGAAISRTAYASLFSAIGTYYGAGDGFTTFNLPDLRGEFIRGWDDGRGADAGRTFGTSQGSQNLWHAHGASSSTAGLHSHGGGTGGAGAHAHSVNSSPGIGQGSGGANTVQQAGGSMTTSAVGDHSHSISLDGNHNHTITVSADGGTEARPRNVAMLACIKF